MKMLPHPSKWMCSAQCLFWCTINLINHYLFNHLFRFTGKHRFNHIFASRKFLISFRLQHFWLTKFPSIAFLQKLSAKQSNQNQHLWRLMILMNEIIFMLERKFWGLVSSWKVFTINHVLSRLLWITTVTFSLNGFHVVYYSCFCWTFRHFFVMSLSFRKDSKSFCQLWNVYNAKEWNV